MCVWEKKTESLEQHYHSSFVCVITLLLHTAMFIITQKHTSLIHVITTSPPLATLSNQPSLSVYHSQ